MGNFFCKSKSNYYEINDNSIKCCITDINDSDQPFNYNYKYKIKYKI